MRFPDAADRFLTTFGSSVIPALVQYSQSAVNKNEMLRTLLGSVLTDIDSGSFSFMYIC
jgi:hypothetical protein